MNQIILLFEILVLVFFWTHLSSFSSSLRKRSRRIRSLFELHFLLIGLGQQCSSMWTGCIDSRLGEDSLCVIIGIVVAISGLVDCCCIVSYRICTIALKYTGLLNHTV